MSKQTKGKFAALDPKHEIFNLLAIDNNAPQWWMKILEDEKLYIEVRKDNYINVYYYGGCVARIGYTASKGLSLKTHQKYMGDIKPVGIDKNGNNRFEYRDCTKELEKDDFLDFLKKNISSIYLKDNEKGRDRRKGKKLEVSSEKKVQGELILKNRRQYVDSEFAYALPKDKGKNELIRFDLVELEDGILKFVELKLISDSRLGGENIDIINQIKKYRDFISDSDNGISLMEYYRKVIDVKFKIGILKHKSLIKDIDKEPFLILVNNYKNPLTTGREKRIAKIESMLKNENIKYEILNYPI